MQTRSQSLVEACGNVAIGCAINCAANLIILPACGVPVSVGQACWIGVLFTGISIARTYVVRRVFNRWHGRNPPS